MEKKKASLANDTGKLDVDIQKNSVRIIYIPMKRAQVHMDQGSQHKFSYTEFDGREGGN